MTAAKKKRQKLIAKSDKLRAEGDKLWAECEGI